MESTFFVPDYLHDLLVASEKGLKGICAELASILSLPVIITDPLFNHLAAAQLVNNVEINYIDNQQEEIIGEKPLVVNCQFTSNGVPINGICSAILLDGRLRGYLFIQIGEDAAEKIARIYSIIAYASSLCTLELRKRLELKQERQQFKEAFIYDLLYGNMKQKNEIISYGNIWGWDFTQSHTIIVFSLIDFDYYSEDQKHIDSLFYLIERVLIESNLKPIAMKKRGEIVVIYQLLGEEMETNESVIKEFIQRVKIQAEIMDRNNRMATGIGRESSNPEELYKSYQEAKVAYEVGLLLNIHTPFFNGLGLERILYKHDLQDVKEYYDHTLGKLEKHDQVHGGELMHTLEFYAANQYDITKTADALFLHRNTLRYRFKKVEEILDKKLDDMNVRLNITAAFKIKQLRKI
ncbi:sugar diacid utilization regulator [Cytobacillus eiseniae]|uniref:Sugar diacid utilization regulator n=1 Tax=Cytobacillus eiseniae TaxID=762947 RepID=A0ABS4RCQ3_9BACI|nr:sugar diacid utilization regulator [Cytobacillus eiseniae]